MLLVKYAHSIFLAMQNSVRFGASWRKREEAVMQTAYQLVWMSKERTRDHLALVDDETDRELTYAELRRS